MNFLKLALGAGAAYVFYQWFLAPASAAAQGTGTPTPASAPTTASTQAATLTTTQQAVINAAGNAGVSPNAMQTFFQWNFYYQQARGVPVTVDPAVAFPGKDPNNYLMSFTEWWAGVSANGLSGLGGNYAISRFLQ